MLWEFFFSQPFSTAQTYGMDAKKKIKKEQTSNWEKIVEENYNCKKYIEKYSQLKCEQQCENKWKCKNWNQNLDYKSYCTFAHCYYCCCCYISFDLNIISLYLAVILIPFVEKNSTFCFYSLFVVVSFDVDLFYLFLLSAHTLRFIFRSFIFPVRCWWYFFCCCWCLLYIYIYLYLYTIENSFLF